jgi:hypothetical protein
MASQHQVKQYLTYWFQLGKKVVIQNGRETRLPQPAIRGDRYSRELEECWREILSPESGDCYLEGTTQTIAELLTPEWEIVNCARCAMPVPMRTRGMPSECCPCFDLPNWPDLESPQPRLPISTRRHLLDICHRLMRESAREA